MVLVHNLKGEQLTVGNTDGGVITQPTYQMVSAKVEKPPSKIVFQTKWEHIDGDSTKPKIKYGVVYYSKTDDGRRSYTYKETNGADGSKNAKVFAWKNEGYYIAHKLLGLSNAYAGTGIKDWYVKNPNNAGYAHDKDAAIAKAQEWFDAKVEPESPTTPDDDDDDGVPYIPPQAPPSTPVSPPPMLSEVDVVEVIDIDEVVINESIITKRGNDFNTYFNVSGGGM
jgi:hypothetical protein